MTEAIDTKKDNPKNNNIALAKVEPLKVEMNTSSEENTVENNTVELENSLIEATRILLRNYGIRKSGAAVRDAVEISNENLGPKEAVSALSALGFKASFGRLNIEKLSEDFFRISVESVRVCEVAFIVNWNADLHKKKQTNKNIKQTIPIVNRHSKQELK